MQKVCSIALEAGFAVLEEGGTAVNAVKAAIVVLEDNILFNAGRGSVFTKKGVQEMDAAIMDGIDLSCRRSCWCAQCAQPD